MLRLAFALPGLILAAAIVWAFGKADFWASGAQIVANPWGLVTLIDLYAGFIITGPRGGRHRALAALGLRADGCLPRARQCRLRALGRVARRAGATEARRPLSRGSRVGAGPAAGPAARAEAGALRSRSGLRP